MAVFKKTIIGKSEQWLVGAAKVIGLDIDGFCHEITSDFVNHVIKEHGDGNSEKSRGNVPINIADFDKIPNIINTPDIFIVGAKRKGKDRIIYAKNDIAVSTLYFEEILFGKRNKSLRSKTMWKLTGAVTVKRITAILTNNALYDLSGAKIMTGGGSHPTCEAAN
jgi:hypothetical protein